MRPVTKTADESSRWEFVRRHDLVAGVKTETIKVCARKYSIDIVRSDDQAICAQDEGVMQVGGGFPFAGHLQIIACIVMRIENE